MLHGLAHKYQPEVIHYQQLAEVEWLTHWAYNRTGWVRIPVTLALVAVIDINGEGLHTDPKRLLHRINSMKGVKPRS